jgi:purine nucleoside phosphorylase
MRNHQISQPQARIGVIGGTGLYDIEGLVEIKGVRKGGRLR